MNRRAKFVRRFATASLSSHELVTSLPRRTQSELREKRRAAAAQKSKGAKGPTLGKTGQG
jgi:hypothetical protein